MKKTISAILALILLILTVSCSNSVNSAEENIIDSHQSSAGETEPETTEAPKYILPSIDLDGKEFHILVGEGYCDTLVDDENGEPLNDAKYAMERLVEETLNVSLDQTKTEFWGSDTTVKTLVMSGDTTYSAVAMMDMKALKCVREGCFIPIQNVETINTNEPYWGGEIVKSLSIAGNLYCAVGSMQLRSFTNTACMLMNKNLADSYSIDIPYDDVFAGTWTLDDINKMNGIATTDINGDSIMDMYDQYTFGVGDIRRAAPQYTMGAGFRHLEKDDNDIPYFVTFGSEKYIGLLEFVYKMLYEGSNNVASFTAPGMQLDSYSMQSLFFDDRVLMYNTMLVSVESLRDMDGDFAILPMPKYDENQNEYISRTEDATYFMIPITESEPENIGAVLDALACVGHYDVLPVYIETLLKDKFSRDSQSRKCIQICIDTRRVDLAESLLYDDFVNEKIYFLLMKGFDKAVSSLEKKQKSVQKKLDKSIEMFEAIGG